MLCVLIIIASWRRFLCVYTIHHFQHKKRKSIKIGLNCSYGVFSKGHKNEFETAAVNEPSVFQPLNFYCMLKLCRKLGYFRVAKYKMATLLKLFVLQYAMLEYFKAKSCGFEAFEWFVNISTYISSSWYNFKDNVSQTYARVWYFVFEYIFKI